MPEDRVTILSTARLHPDDVARRTFATARRGFDPGEVRAFLEQVAREMVAAADREHEMRRAVTEAEHRAANPVLDEATLTTALGHETARVLRSAHDAAAELTARAEGEVNRLRTQAQEEADQLQRRSEQSAADRAAQSDAAAADLRRRAHEEATQKIESAKLEAEALVAQSRAECRAMVQEAQELRARVLADLARRRRVLHSQIEQLRAGRERLAETIGDVRHAVDDITDELFRAEDQARLAAEAAGRQAAQEEPAELAILETRTDIEGEDTAESGAAESARQQAVDELFARLRAEADAGLTVPVEMHPAAEAPPGDRERGPSGAAPSRPRTAGAVAVVDVPAPRPADTAETEPSPATEVHPAAAAAPGPEAGADSRSKPARGPVDPVLLKRDEMLAPVVSMLARRLKRALQDDQNDILDRLRAKGGWAPGVLPSEDEHTQRYVRAAVDQLMEASRAGAAFAGGKADEAPPVGDVATELAAGIVVPLRRRLEDEGSSVASGDDSALLELVGASYREWKGARAERLAGDQAVYAFGRAALSAVTAGTALRWVVDDGTVECPDCDDNALAGPIPSGDAFPTGHVHPPAHPGCRCLLAPLDA
jgi:DivIVA domain-containing protein